MKPAVPIAILATLLACACRDVPVVDTGDNGAASQLREGMIAANQAAHEGERARIEGYLNRRGWQTVALAGGERLMVTRHGAGRRIESGDTVRVRYGVEAINGTVYYAPATDTLVAGRRKPTPGLDRALTALARGDRARLVVPSFEGYGVVGDGNRIGSREILVYDLEILD